MAATTSTTTRRGSRTGVSGLTLAGLAAGALKFAQDHTSDFKPSLLVSVLIAACAFFAGMALERFVLLLTRRRTLDKHLRSWPLERMESADALVLGVFPSTTGDASDGLGPYAPRHVDAAVEGALSGVPEARRNVVIFGPEGAGKSRTAYEMARKACARTEVVVPASGDGLAELLEDDAWLAVPDDALLWLDDIERYLDALGTSAGPRILGRGNPMTVVGTIRDDKYREMLSAGGTLGESAKRLLASSLVVSLDPRPETLGKDAFLAGHEAPALPVERPKEDRSPGQLVVAALKRSRAVVTLALAPLAFVIRRLGSKRPDAIADDAVLAGALGGLEIAGIVLAVVIAASGFSAKPAESIAKQIDAVTPPDARVLFDKTVSMREGEKAQVLAFGQRDRSSILRIYSLGAIADGSEKLSLEPRNEPRQFFFLDRPQLVDIDDNGSREMLLRYVTAVGGGRNLTIPVLVVRAGEDQFTAWPLLQTRPRYAGGRAARRHMDAFGTRFDLGPKLRSGFGVTSAIPVPGLSLLVTASELDTTRDHARLAIALYEVEITNRAVSATLACSARHPGGIVVAVAPRAFDSDYTGYLKSTYRSLVPQLSGGGEKGKCPSKPVLPSAATSF